MQHPSPSPLYMPPPPLHRSTQNKKKHPLPQPIQPPPMPLDLTTLTDDHMATPPISLRLV